MNNPLAEEAKPEDRENTLKRILLRRKCNLSKYCLKLGKLGNLTKRWMQLNKILLNSAKIYQMNSPEELSILNKENEQTPLKNGMPLFSIVQIIQIQENVKVF